MQITYYLLGLTTAVVPFIAWRNLAYGLLSVVVSCALFEGVITWSALGYLLTLLCLTVLYFNSFKIKAPIFKIILLLMLSFMLAGLVLHDIPGFYNFLAVDRIKIGASRKFFSLYLNLDKVMGALIVYVGSRLIFVEQRFNFAVIRQILKILLACMATIIIPALLINYVKVDIKLPAIWPIWIASNWLFVSFSEEVIFRGFVQRELTKFLARTHWIWPLILSSLIFGLSHYRQGAVYIGFASICGLFYGYAYHKTHRVLAAMAVHFLFNLAHFVAFTYPN